MQPMIRDKQIWHKPYSRGTLIDAHERVHLPGVSNTFLPRYIKRKDNSVPKCKVFERIQQANTAFAFRLSESHVGGPHRHRLSEIWVASTRSAPRRDAPSRVSFQAAFLSSQFSAKTIKRSAKKVWRTSRNRNGLELRRDNRIRSSRGAKKANGTQTKKVSLAKSFFFF